MSLTEKAISSLIDNSKIDVTNSCNIIQETIQKTFNSIQDDLITKIKSDIQNELIKKLSGENYEEDVKKYEVNINTCHEIYKHKIKLEKDEYYIYYVEYNKEPDNLRMYHKHFIGFTNLNNMYYYYLNPHYNNITCNRDMKLENKGKHIRIPINIIEFLKKIMEKCFYVNCANSNEDSKKNFLFQRFENNNSYDSRISYHFENFLLSIPSIVYDFVEKYYADRHYGIYGNKFEYIVNDYNKMDEKIKKQEEINKKQKEEIIKIEEEKNRIKKEYDELKEIHDKEVEKMSEIIKINTELQKQIKNYENLRQCLLNLENNNDNELNNKVKKYFFS
jgi:hypothetical protein